MKNKLFVVVALALVLAGFVLLKYFAPPQKTTDTAPVKASGTNFVRPHSPTFGNSLARVTVVEWFDPECESCREIHSTVKKIISEYKDRVHFVFRYMPYHEGSMFAATALEEAREMGKYEEALDLLFEKQPEWGSHHAPKPELIPGYLETLGIPKEKLNREDLQQKHGHKIRLDEEDGNAVGVRGTPSFFVNGELLRELGEGPLRSAIDQAIHVTK